jgi:hypothetical protein
MWKSTLSSEVSIILSFNVIMTVDSIIINTSLTCSWCVSRCNLVAGSTGIEGAIPFEMRWIATLETLILSSCIVSTIGSLVRIIRLMRWAWKKDRKNYNSNSLRFPDLLM